MDLVAIFFAVGAAFCWALTWLMMKLGADRMPWLGFGLLRPWIALPFIVPYALWTDGIQVGSLDLVLIAMIAGTINVYLGNVLFFYAVARGSLHTSTLLSNTGPFWGVVSSILILAEPVRWFTFAAGTLVFAGAYFLVRPARKVRGERHDLLARLAALGTGVLWGSSAAVPTKYCLSRGIDPVDYQVLFLCGAALAWTIAAGPTLVRRSIRFTSRGVLYAAGSSLLGLFVGWVLWLTALERVDASLLSPLWGLAPLLTVVLSVVFLGERVAARALLGGALVLSGVTLVSVMG